MAGSNDSYGADGYLIVDHTSGIQDAATEQQIRLYRNRVSALQRKAGALVL